MPKQFEGMGFSLMYPDTWSLAEETGSESNRGLILESPGGAFISVNVYDSDGDPEDLVDEAAEAMESEYEDIESEPLNMCIAGEDLDGIVQRFYYLDFVVVSKLAAWARDGQTYLIQIQGEDREVDAQTMVFEAILTSMFRSLIH